MVNPSLEHVHRFAHEAMGTLFEVAVAGQEKKYAEQASMAVFREVDRLENLFSRFNPCSELGQINRLRPDESLRIGLEVYECLKTAEQVRLDTAGAFDINYKARLRIRGPEGTERFQPGGQAGNPGYELSSGADGFSIRLPELGGENYAASLDLDLGGIGKGYALDRAVSILSDWTVERALVHSGTSTAVAFGSAPGLKEGEEGWPVGVGGKWSSADAPGRVLLRDRALSGSGTEVKGGHILDPGTGREAESHLAAWVSHPSAAIADAISTAFMVMRQDEVEAYCRSHPEVWALVITNKGEPVAYNSKIFLFPPSGSPGRRILSSASRLGRQDILK